MQISGFQLYVAKRLGYVVITAFVMTAIVFSTTQLLPGNAAVMMLGKSATEEKVDALEEDLGLDQPWYVQYTSWVGGLLKGDAGTSLTLDRPVVEVVIPNLINSMYIAVLALLSTIFVGIPLGVISALKRNSIIDRSISALSYLGVSVPSFVSATLLIMFLGGPIFRVFPSSGFVPLQEGIFPWITHLVLPVATLTILLTAHVMRQTRSEMIEVLNSEYVRSAKLKGLKERTVIVKHALRNGLLPTITILAIDFGWLMGGLVIVEEIFAYPGLGRMVIYAIENRDLPLLQFLVLIIAFSYAIANLGADLLYSYLDPRIDYGSGQ